MSLYGEKIEALINAALADGVLTEKEKQILFKKAQAEGIDLDEFEMVLDARLVELQKKQKKEESHAAPKSDKFGDVRKCPACGALVPALAVSCPECGYEFSGVQASSSSQKLAKEISEVKKAASAKKNELIKSKQYSTKKEKGEILSPQEEALYSIDNDAESQINSLVENFPVPNTKNDLFDLLLYLKQQGYKHKYKECLNRAKMLFPKDPLFAQIQESAKAEEAKEKKEERSFNIQTTAMMIIYIGVIVATWTLFDWGIGRKILVSLVGAPLIAMPLGFLISAIYKRIAK